MWQRDTKGIYRNEWWGVITFFFRFAVSEVHFRGEKFVLESKGKERPLYLLCRGFVRPGPLFLDSSSPLLSQRLFFPLRSGGNPINTFGGGLSWAQLPIQTRDRHNTGGPPQKRDPAVAADCTFHRRAFTMRVVGPLVLLFVATGSRIAIAESNFEFKQLHIFKFPKKERTICTQNFKITFLLSDNVANRVFQK